MMAQHTAVEETIIPLVEQWHASIARIAQYQDPACSVKLENGIVAVQFDRMNVHQDQPGTQGREHIQQAENIAKAVKGIFGEAVHVRQIIKAPEQAIAEFELSDGDAMKTALDDNKLVLWAQDALPEQSLEA